MLVLKLKSKSKLDLSIYLGSSHFVAVAKALGVAKGFLSAPHYLDAAQLCDGSHSIGLLHIGNLGQGQDAEKARRWSMVYSRFVRDPFAAHKAGSDFYFDLRTMMPNVPLDVFDSEVLSWNPATTPLDQTEQPLGIGACPWKYAHLHTPSQLRPDDARQVSSAALVNLGAVLFEMQKTRDALACFAAARALAGDGGHGAVADDNSQIIRSRKCGFLSQPLTTSQLRAKQEQVAAPDAEGDAGDDATSSLDIVNVGEAEDDDSNPAPNTRRGARWTGVSGGQDLRTGRGKDAPRRQSLAHKLGDHVTNFSCPVVLIEDEELRRAPMSLTNLGTDVLYPEGRIGEALACFQEAVDVMNNCRETDKGRGGGASCAVSSHVRAAVESNYDAMMEALRPGNKGGRVFHNIGGRKAEFPDHMDPSHVPGAPDETILVWDGALTDAQCEHIIDVFEDSDHYVGNLVSNGKIVVDHKHKKASEFEVASGAVKDPRWAAIEMQLLSILIKTTLQFEKKNPIIKQLKNPFGDEGFRMKRYVDDGTEHHAYHADSGQEAPCAPRRVLAILIYFNSIEEGGETVFLQQGDRVAPKCGRVLMFPTAFTHVHAGLPPRKGIKYNAVNFLTIQ